MAARRLIWVMLALLVLSSAAAALVPIDRATRRASTTTTSTATADPTGRALAARVDVGAATVKRIPVRLGDNLTLTVTADAPHLVEVVGLGQTEDVDPDAPAVFDLRPYAVGSHPVRLAGSGRRIALIEVSRPRGS